MHDHTVVDEVCVILGCMLHWNKSSITFHLWCL